MCLVYYVKGPIHVQSCCAEMFCATQVCPFTINHVVQLVDFMQQIVQIANQHHTRSTSCTTRNVAQHD
jgi:hypothetical protein